jgi:C_GCAxxG_C_C family probable redox protein
MNSKNVEAAFACYQEGFSCAQAILAAYGPQFGLDRETALRVAGAFGAGIARMGKTCGAVTGAIMVIGLKYGKTKADDDAARERTYAVVGEFMDRFISRNRSSTCKDLLGHDLSTPEGRTAVKEKKLADTLCPKFVRDAAEILEEIL